MPSRSSTFMMLVCFVLVCDRACRLAILPVPLHHLSLSKKLEVLLVCVDCLLRNVLCISFIVCNIVTLSQRHCLTSFVMQQAMPGIAMQLPWCHPGAMEISCS